MKKYSRLTINELVSRFRVPIECPTVRNKQYTSINKNATETLGGHRFGSYVYINVYKRILRKNRLKISRLRLCEFKSRLGHQPLLPQGLQRTYPQVLSLVSEALGNLECPQSAQPFHVSALAQPPLIIKNQKIAEFLKIESLSGQGVSYAR